MIRIALREINRLADIYQTSFELATLASVALGAALRACRKSVKNSMERFLMG